jgi:hypothetical protein
MERERQIKYRKGRKEIRLQKKDERKEKDLFQYQ